MPPTIQYPAIITFNNSGEILFQTMKMERIHHQQNHTTRNVEALNRKKMTPDENMDL